MLIIIEEFEGFKHLPDMVGSMNMRVRVCVHLCMHMCVCECVCVCS